MRTSLALGLALAVAAFGCGGDDDDTPATPDAATSDPIDAATPDADLSDAGFQVLPEDLPDPLPQGIGGPLKVTSYNAGLIQLLKFNNERLPLIIEAVKGIDADVVCMQEVWFEFTTQKDFAEAVSETFPHSFWTWTGDTAFGTGLLILSKHPLFRGREQHFPGDGGAVDRAVISADVVTPDSYFHFVCTHLEAFELSIQNAEIDKIAQYVDDNGYTGEPTFLLGDFNTGPSTGCFYTAQGCEPDSRIEAYNRLLTTWTDAADGFAADTECTYCREFADPMQLIPTTNFFEDVRIDGCLYKDLGAAVPTAVQIILKDLVTYESGGETRMTQLSDHRGIECNFSVD